MLPSFETLIFCTLNMYMSDSNVLCIVWPASQLQVNILVQLHVKILVLTSIKSRAFEKLPCFSFSFWILGFSFSLPLLDPVHAWHTHNKGQSYGTRSIYRKVIASYSPLSAHTQTSLPRDLCLLLFRALQCCVCM